jgi:cathepsin A (carboxypeptidase C)/serine carboxypeptidase-like clade 2
MHFSSPEVEAARIKLLPNYNDPRPIDFDQYSGHLQLKSNGQKMFYWFVESENDPKTDPVVLWLNGGPGCSSLGGLFTELGPFVVEGDMSVKRNVYAWNRRANMIFLESPSGVGFSSPMLHEDNYNEDFTTNRTYEFLQQFFDMYSAFQRRDFYVMGESYAGRYIPYLVHKLVKEPISTVNLVGFSIGNPVP